MLITLTVTDEVVEEAQTAGAGLIISHHPLIFQSLRHLDLKEPVVRLIRQLLVRGITLYVAHTNLDVVEGGVSAALAEALELKEVKPPHLPVAAQPGQAGHLRAPGRGGGSTQGGLRGGSGSHRQLPVLHFPGVGGGRFRAASRRLAQRGRSRRTQPGGGSPPGGAW